MKFSIPLGSEGIMRGASLETAPARELLMVSESEQPHIYVRHLLGRTGWTVSSRFDIAEAADVLNSRKFPVVMCDCDLSEGGWRWLLSACQHSERPPRFIVFCRFAEEALWGEVLNVGGYDLLLYPFQGREVARVTDMAWDSWVREGPRAMQAAVPELAQPNHRPLRNAAG